MAQTKRKRRTKHRGNAVGIVEARGRTGRPATPSERRAAQRQNTRGVNRFDHPPTWRSATNRALFAVVIFVAVIVLAFGQSLAQALALGAVMLLLYIPMGYYTDLFIYRRRQARKLTAAQAAGAKRKSSGEASESDTKTKAR